eukprot:Sdes_comp23803_c0_seq1m21954
MNLRFLCIVFLMMVHLSCWKPIDGSPLPMPQDISNSFFANNQVTYAGTNLKSNVNGLDVMAKTLKLFLDTSDWEGKIWTANIPVSLKQIIIKLVQFFLGNPMGTYEEPVNFSDSWASFVSSTNTRLKHLYNLCVEEKELKQKQGIPVLDTDYKCTIPLNLYEIFSGEDKLDYFLEDPSSVPMNSQMKDILSMM